MPDSKFDLGDYVEVKDRIKLFYELFGGGRLVTDSVEILTAPDNKQRVMVRALAFRTVDDPHPAVGCSWMELPGTTSYTRGSELENTETSAWGRAIAALGILVDRSIASASEIRNKASDGTRATSEPRDGTLIGNAEAAKAPHDFELRSSPDGASIGFGLKEGKQIVRVVAHGPLAEQIAALREAVEGKRITVYGVMVDDAWTIQAGTKQEKVVPYIRLTASRVTGADGLDLPLTDPTPQEAASEPSDVTEEAVDASMSEAETAPAGPDVSRSGPAAQPKCLDKQDGLGVVCMLPGGHTGKHRELATDGRVLASW